MKDNLQNISDLIGALAEDIEEIKKILAAKDASDKDEAVKRLAVELEPVIRFFGGSTPGNISDIFRSKETIEAYKKSLGEESKHSKKCTFYTLRFGCSFAAVNTIKPQLL